MKLTLPLSGCAALLALAGVGSLLAQQPSSTPDPLDGLRAALRADADAKKERSTESEARTRNYEQNYNFTNFVQLIRDALAHGNDDAALATLTQLQTAALSEDVRKACDALAAQLSKTRAEKEAAFNTEVDAALKRAGDAVLAAKEPKDLDAPLQELGRLADGRANRYSDGNQNRAGTKLQGAVTFLSRWQDYLLATARGDDSGASNLLRNLADSSGGYNQTLLIPRSEILARQPAGRDSNGESLADRNNHKRRSASEIDAAVTDILDHTRTLDDMPAAIGKLVSLRAEASNGSSYPDYNTDLGSALSNLQSLQKNRLELQSGLGTMINLTSIRSDNNNSQQRPGIESRLVPLRMELLDLALPRLLDSPTEKPAADESVNNFLRRLIEAAKKRQDWAAVVRGLEISRVLASSPNTYASTNSQENEAYKQFLTGLNMEDAGQYQQAVIAYLTALKTGVQDLPAKLIGEHLAAIQQAHAKEYTEANTYVLNPPVPQYPGGAYGPNGPYGARGPYDPRFNRPGFPGMPGEQPTPPVLTVPAMPTPTPTVAPTPAASATPVPKGTP